MRQLTIKQTETLVAFAELSRDGIPPTIRELARDAGIGFDTMRHRLLALQRKGYIHSEFYRNRARALTPLALEHPAIAPLFAEQGPAPSLPQYIVTGRLGRQMGLVWARGAA